MAVFGIYVKHSGVYSSASEKSPVVSPKKRHQPQMKPKAGREKWTQTKLAGFTRRKEDGIPVDVGD